MAGAFWWSVPIDPRDVRQERELALLERRCPDKAARAWYQRERLWYRFHLSFPDNEEPDYVDSWIEAFRAATPQDLVINRSEASKEQRKEYVREWWRKNGRAYRRQRQDQGRTRRNERPRSGARSRTD